MDKPIDTPESQDSKVVKVAEALYDQRTTTPDDPVESFFNQPVPQSLWHYTSLAGFEGILASGKVWATEAHYTTDPSEFVHAREIAMTHLQSIHPRNDSEKLAHKSAIQIVEEEFESGSLSQERQEVFIASFSEVEDLKSQWIDYADHGRGVSICFDLRQIRPPKELRVAVTLAPCIYEKLHAKRLLKFALSHYWDTSERMLRNTTDLNWVGQQLKDWRLVDRVLGRPFDRSAFDALMDEKFTEELRIALTLTKFDLLRVASHCKNPYYSEEREWRLALPHMKSAPLTHMTIEYRGPNKNIPYVAHNLFHQGKLPISKVLLGPLCEDRKKIDDVLNRHGYATPIMRSNAPVRTPDQI